MYAIRSYYEANTSTGAPPSICCRSVPDAAKFNSTLIFGLSSSNAAATSVIASVKLDAAETVIVVVVSSGDSVITSYSIHYTKLYEKNELLQKKKKTFLSRILKIFSEPMFVLLFIAAFVYFFLGEPRDGSIMVISVAFICAIEFFQEWRTDRTLQALKDLSSPKSTVIRNGKIMTIESKELTVDDLLILKEGEKIAADGIIIENYGLGVNESTLTGESDVVWKKIDLDT